jgi:conjugal transfer/entry exclusion protein
LESSLNNATRDKNVFFDQLQLRQAEAESAQAHLESLEHQNTELQFQLRESNDRLALLREECAELVREQENRVRDPINSADEIARMVSATEVKYEGKLAELRRNLAVMEKERYESEVDWSRKLKEKVKDLEDLKRVLGSATKTRENDENVFAELKAQLSEAQGTIQTLQLQNSELPLLRDQIQELEVSSIPDHLPVPVTHFNLPYRNRPGSRQK